MDMLIDLDIKSEPTMPQHHSTTPNGNIAAGLEDLFSTPTP